MADKAIADVTRIWIELGCACDPVFSDYGEDLIVQPSCQGRMDPFRILVQVRGARSLERYRRKNGRYTLPVRLESFYKWARSSDLTIVVLWDTSRQTGLWSAPQDGYDNWRFFCGAAKPAKITFAPSSSFDVLAASKIVWKARIRYFENLIVAAQAEEPTLIKEKRAAKARKKKDTKQADLLAFELLILLGMVDQKFYFNPEVALVARVKAAELCAIATPSRLIVHAGMVWTLIVRIEAFTNERTPGVVLEACGRMLLKIVHKYGIRSWKQPTCTTARRTA